MITIKLINEQALDLSDADVTLVTGPYPHDVGPFSHVYGSGIGAIVTAEPPQLLINRLSTRADFAVLQRPNGTPVWIHGPSVSMVRPPEGEEQPRVNAIVVVGAFHQAVQESVPLVLQILQGHNARIA